MKQKTLIAMAVAMLAASAFATEPTTCTTNCGGNGYGGVGGNGYGGVGGTANGGVVRTDVNVTNTVRNNVNTTGGTANGGVVRTNVTTGPASTTSGAATSTSTSTSGAATSTAGAATSTSGAATTTGGNITTGSVTGPTIGASTGGTAYGGDARTTGGTVGSTTGGTANTTGGTVTTNGGQVGATTGGTVGSTTGGTVGATTGGNITASGGTNTNAGINGQGGSATIGTGAVQIGATTNAGGTGGSSNSGGNTLSTGASTASGNVSGNVTTGAVTVSTVDSKSLEVAQAQAQGQRDAAHEEALGRVEAARQKIKNTPSVNPSPLTSSNDTCMGSASGSLNLPGVGIGLGKTYVDANCVMLKNARELWNMGMRAASMALMCKDADNREALELTGYVCPQTERDQKKTAAANGDQQHAMVPAIELTN